MGQGCFNVHQVRAWRETFDKNNLTRWKKQNWVVALRKGFYSFPECLPLPNFAFYVSNFIYKPSYVSLHTALAFHGVIPEAVTQITAVSTLKTAVFENAFGSFHYQKVGRGLLFGYDSLPFGEHAIRMAQPEKAILDLLYLHPFYNTEREIENLRFGENFMREELNVGRLMEYAGRFKNKALEKRVALLEKVRGA